MHLKAEVKNVTLLPYLHDWFLRFLFCIPYLCGLYSSLTEGLSSLEPRGKLEHGLMKANPSLILETLCKVHALLIKISQQCQRKLGPAQHSTFLGRLTSHSVMSASCELKDSLLYSNNIPPDMSRVLHNCLTPFGEVFPDHQTRLCPLLYSHGNLFFSNHNSHYILL